MFAAPRSGSGKTLVVCGVMQALVNRGLEVTSFKTGPDFIDPMFHSRVIGAKSRNLDGFMAGKDGVRDVFARHASSMGVSVLEGVMGFYDGLGGDDLEASSYRLSEDLGLPVVLVVDCGGASTTVAAVVKGMKTFRKNDIRAVVLNRISERIYPEVKAVIEKEAGVEVLGRLPKVPELVIESRNLGLMMPSEIEDIRDRLSKLAEVVEENIDLDRILDIAASAGPVDAPPEAMGGGQRVRVAVASDEAFCFIYPDNVELLESLGAEIVYFSPMVNPSLPDGVRGLVLPGGYPDLHMEKLSANVSLREDILGKLSSGMPCLAEDGGFMYLNKTMGEGRVPMVGFLDGHCFPTDRLVRFGYLTLEPGDGCRYIGDGEGVNGHEFHYWDCSENGDSCVALKARRGERHCCMVSKGNTLAGWPHLYYPSNPRFAERFLDACREYRA
ncbi:MAG: cobyrinate a,c-diamide synthase [Thermoplasmatales archaeon]|nr:cobyrinate a,c-diamide synthase [Thermoplasmatales archaeon]